MTPPSADYEMIQVLSSIIELNSWLHLLWAMQYEQVKVALFDLFMAELGGSMTVSQNVPITVSYQISSCIDSVGLSMQ